MRADVRGGIRELANQRACGLIVEAVEIFVVVRLNFQVRVAIRELDDLEPTMRAKACFKTVIGRIIDERGVVRAHRKKGRKALDESRSKSLIDPGLVCQMAVEIFRGVEGIVRFADVKRENRGVKLGFVPTAELHGFGELLAVHANRPGKQAG